MTDIYIENTEMKETWTKKVKWFGSIIPTTHADMVPEEWTHVYNNSLGNPVRCCVVKDNVDKMFGHSDNYSEILNENRCRVWLLKSSLREL